MSTRRAEEAAPGEAAPVEEETEAPPAEPRLPLEEYLPDASAWSEAAPARAERAASAAAVGMRTAQVTSISGRRVTLTLRGSQGPVQGEIAPEVDADVVADACENGDAVLVEVAEGDAPVVVGVLQTRRPKEIRLRAGTVVLEGEREILLRSGRGAIRIREDGDIEVVGSRISAASRGLFRIVGRLLRLN